MKKQKSKLWDALDRARAGMNLSDMAAKPPDGAFSLGEYAMQYNLSHSGARGQIKELIESGAVISLGLFGPKGTRYYRVNRPPSPPKTNIKNNP